MSTLAYIIPLNITNICHKEQSDRSQHVPNNDIAVVTLV